LVVVHLEVKFDVKVFCLKKYLFSGKRGKKVFCPEKYLFFSGKRGKKVFCR